MQDGKICIQYKGEFSTKESPKTLDEMKAALPTGLKLVEGSCESANFPN